MICSADEISACISTPHVDATPFYEQEIKRTIDHFAEYEPYEYSNEFNVFELTDGRFAWVAHHSWGTCEMCGGDSTEVIVSDDLLELWYYALTDEARVQLKILEKEVEELSALGNPARHK
jgi:hypothetical protein